MKIKFLILNFIAVTFATLALCVVFASAASIGEKVADASVKPSANDDLKVFSLEIFQNYLHKFDLINLMNLQNVANYIDTVLPIILEVVGGAKTSCIFQIAISCVDEFSKGADAARQCVVREIKLIFKILLNIPTFLS